MILLNDKLSWYGPCIDEDLPVTDLMAGADWESA